jgi:hypothetical protein
MPSNPAEKAPLLSATELLKNIVIAMPEQQRCDNCEHWQKGCKLAGGQIPPKHVQKAGRQSWMWDGVPFQEWTTRPKRPV